MMIHSTLSALSLNITDGKHGDCENSPTSGYYFISCKDVRDGTIHYEDARQITERDFFDAHKRTLLEPNDILITNSGTIGRMAFVTDTPQTSKTTFQKSVAIVKPNPNKIIPKYLYYVLLNSIDSFITQANGSAQKNLLLSTMRSFNLFIDDDKQVQARIASILSSYDDLIENNQKQIKLLEEAAQRLYKEWFVDLRFPGWEKTKIVDGVPEGWERLPLPQIADIQYGFAFDGSLFNSSGYGTPIVRIRNIPDAETSDFTSEEASSEYLINNGDIIVGMDGEFHINSWAGGQAYLVQRTCCIRPKIEKMRGWLLYSIHEPIKYFENTIVGATVAHLGKKNLDSITLLLPTEELYAPFISIFDKRQILMEENIKLREVRDRLIYMLMSTN